MNRLPAPTRVLGGLAVVSGLFLVTACGSNPSPSTTSGSGDKHATTSSTAASPPAASSTSDSGSSSSSSPAQADTPTTSTGSPSQPDTPDCTAADLRFTLGQPDGAAGSAYVPVVMVNKSDHACRTGGYGGVSYVDQASGDPIGAPATRNQAAKPTPFVLLPGGHATASLREVAAGDFSDKDCQPQKATGLRIYPPNQKASVFVPDATTACANAKVQLLELKPYRPVK